MDCRFANQAGWAREMVVRKVDGLRMVCRQSSNAVFGAIGMPAIHALSNRRNKKALKLRLGTSIYIFVYSESLSVDLWLSLGTEVRKTRVHKKTVWILAGLPSMRYLVPLAEHYIHTHCLQ